LRPRTIVLWIPLVVAWVLVGIRASCFVSLFLTSRWLIGTSRALSWIASYRKTVG
jgi:hypothetical protein